MKYVFNTFTALLPEKVNESNMFGSNGKPRVSFYFPSKEEIRKIILFAKMISKKSRPLILDIGCGNGYVAYLLARTRKVDVIAIDPNSDLIEESKKIYKLKNLKFEAMDSRQASEKYAYDKAGTLSEIDMVVNSWMPVNCNFTPDIHKINPKAILYVRYKDNDTVTGKQSGFFQSYKSGKNYRIAMLWTNDITSTGENSVVEIQLRNDIVFNE